MARGPLSFPAHKNNIFEHKTSLTFFPTAVRLLTLPSHPRHSTTSGTANPVYALPLGQNNEMCLPNQMHQGVQATEKLANHPNQQPFSSPAHPRMTQIPSLSMEHSHSPTLTRLCLLESHHHFHPVQGDRLIECASTGG
eukprot:GHVN01011559.1.p1 GENE.GHVN01011559.1~~GHVN01011559.1.p1  ORF type:complete len:139 (+),score=21.52 GHVN01011559.1:71-487(+)